MKVRVNEVACGTITQIHTTSSRILTLPIRSGVYLRNKLPLSLLSFCLSPQQKKYLRQHYNQNETHRPSSKELDAVVNHLNLFLCNISDFCHCLSDILTSSDPGWNSDLIINGDLLRKHLQPTRALQKRTKQCCNYLYCNVCLHRWDTRMARSMYLPWRHLRLGLQMLEPVNAVVSLELRLGHKRLLVVHSNRHISGAPKFVGFTGV